MERTMLIMTEGGTVGCQHCYKTVARYGLKEFVLSQGLTHDIDAYIKINNVRVGDYLFDTDKLTKYVSAENRKMGFNFGVSEFRNMKIADEIAKRKLKTPAERLALSQEMGHSPFMQDSYTRSNVI